MTEPIRVYPTETPTLYETEDHRPAIRLPGVAGWWLACSLCQKPLRPGPDRDWLIADRPYCSRCVQVAGEAVAL